MSRRRRHYGGAVSVNLGRYADLDRNVTTKDVLVGLAIGIIGAAGGAFALKKARSMVNPIAALAAPASGLDLPKTAAPILGGLAAAAAAWFGLKQKDAQKAFGYAVGSVGAGALIAFAYSPVAAQIGFNGVVGLNLPYGGMLIDDTSGESLQVMSNGMGGLIVDDQPSAMRGYADRSGMGRLAAASLDPDEDMGELSRLAAFADHRGYAELDIDGQG